MTRLYHTQSWRRLRRRVIAQQPWCAHCGVILTKANAQVDHITPISQGGAKRDLDNLQALCASCHSTKTAKGGEAGAVKIKRIKGCDENGMPLDPEHPWRK